MTKQDVDSLINKIELEIPKYKVNEKNLKKFDANKALDAECLSYVNDGVGGAYVKFLALLTKYVAPKNIVELGNQKGFSTLAIYDQLPNNSHFTTIDTEHDQRYCPDNMFSDSRVQFLFGDDCDVAMLKSMPQSIDLLFSDTIHYNFQIQDEWDIYQHLLADTAIVTIDDIHKNDKGIFWDSLPYDKWDLTDLCHHTTGWGLFLYKREESQTYDARWTKAVEASSHIWRRKYEELNKEKMTREEKRFLQISKSFIKKNPALYNTVLRIKGKKPL